MKRFICLIAATDWLFVMSSWHFLSWSQNFLP